VANAEAVVPSFRWVTVADVATQAASLGLPFHLTRLARGHKFLKVQPELLPGVNGGVGWGGLGSRTQIMLVTDSRAAPDFVYFAGTSSWFAPGGVVRVADWRPMPASPSFSMLPEVREALGSLDQGVARTSDVPTDILPFDRRVRSPFSQFGSNATHQDPAWASENWWRNGSFYSEAPRLHRFLVDTRTSPTGWTKAGDKIGIFPVPACQWGAAEIQAHPAPSADAKWIDLSTLPSPAEPSDLAGVLEVDPWEDKGGFAVLVLDEGFKPTPPTPPP